MIKRNIPGSILLAMVVLFTASDLAVAQGRRRPREGAGQVNLYRPPLAKDDAEKKILAVLKEMTGDRGLRYLSVSENDGRFLRQLAEASGAKRVVEFGTSTGYSGLWFSLALRKTGGKLITHELNPERARQARANFKKAGVEDLITVVEGNAHETMKKLKDPIDLIFIDADKEGYIDYLNKLLPLVRPGGLILAHNMRTPPVDPKYHEAITTNPDLETTFALMEGAGIGVTLKKR